ncbi:hypothetical protein OUHCRE12_14960 [Enterobacter kobei]|nr:MAG TPA: hypothetical protein [Caudoviricetes sp.]
MAIIAGNSIKTKDAPIFHALVIFKLDIAACKAVTPRAKKVRAS